MRFNPTILERAYFSDLSTLSEEIISQLADKIKNKETIRSGDSFIVDLGDNHDLEIKFYKDYSRRAREFLKKRKAQFADTKVRAFYFDDISDKADGTIEIYLNYSKPYYYKNLDSIDIVNSRLPKFIKDILRHEITHAYETNLTEFGDVRPNSEQEQEYDEYVNSDEEINAVFNGVVSSAIYNDKLINYYVAIGDINAAMRALVLRITNEPEIDNLSDENKKWILKTAYTTLQDQIEKNSIES